ncbi:MAG: YbaB/EbfC family nucleoid-associated protein [Eubacteriales bacterium]|jgi:DNA-binding YbaB/EbfC family protein|nr:YbaB/EbfC family nucleoid-associated protein [Eubacteriales bacterium]
MAKGGFPGGMGGGNMQQLMVRAQKMQQDVQRAQAELNVREFTASSGGAMVNVTVTGNKDVKSIVINPACVDPDDVEMLQDLVLSAVNEALRTATKTVEDEIGKITGGMGLGL